LHELPAAQSILEISLRHAKQAGAERVTNVYLVIGQLASLVDDSIQFYWDIIAEGTPAKGAKLHFKRIPAQLQCMVCSEKYFPTGEEIRCPNCDSVGVKVIAGEEFFVEAIDVDGEGVTP
jgi:hydrogenase nickel incorporation protein HypA/HybF